MKVELKASALKFISFFSGIDIEVGYGVERANLRKVLQDLLEVANELELREKTLEAKVSTLIAERGKPIESGAIQILHCGHPISNVKQYLGGFLYMCRICFPNFSRLWAKAREGVAPTNGASVNTLDAVTAFPPPKPPTAVQTYLPVPQAQQRLREIPEEGLC